MSDKNNILLYAAALYQVKEPKVYSIEAKTLMALMLTHMVRLVNLIESSTEKLPPDGLSDFDYINTLAGAICEDELHDDETDHNVPKVRAIQGQARWQSSCDEAPAKATHSPQVIQSNYHAGRLF